MEKILTVVVPTYNMEQYLDRCLSSLIVAPELMKLLEVIVVNDGSKDRSSEIAHGYSERYPDTFVVIDKENGNYGSCINVSVPVSNGRFIKILDADDCFDNANFIDYLRLLNSPEVVDQADCIFSDYCSVSEKDGRKVLHSMPSNDREHSFFSLEDISKNDRQIIQMWGVAYRTKILKTIEYRQTEGISYTDQEWMFLPMSKVNRIFHFSKPLYLYTVGREGQTMDTAKYARDISMEIQGIYVMLDEYASQEGFVDDLHRQYLLDRLEIRCRGIYRHFFVDMYKALKSQRARLLQFDSYLKEKSLVLYLLTDNFSVHKIVQHKLVHNWRLHKRFSNPAVAFFRLCYALCEFKDKMIECRN